MKIKNYTIYDRSMAKNWNKFRDSKEEKDYFIPLGSQHYETISKSTNGLILKIK